MGGEIDTTISNLCNPNCNVIQLSSHMLNLSCRMRNLHTLVNMPLFRRVWNDSDTDDRNIILAKMSAFDREGIYEWLWHHDSILLAEKPYRILLRLAARAGVHNYSRLTKWELVRELEHARLPRSKDTSRNNKDVTDKGMVRQENGG